MRWIAVKDQLPPLGKPVLITTGKIIVVASRDNSGRQLWWDSEGFSGYEWEWHFEPENVTHWMELPPLPRRQPLSDIAIPKGEE